MAVQERFTPEEWQQVVAGPVDAGMLIAFVQPQGPIGLAHEMKAIYDATVTGVINSPSELIREVGALLARPKGEGGEADLMKASAQQAKDHSRGDPQAFYLEKITQAAALVSQKVPADATAYRQWLVECAEKTAQAAKEGGFFGFGGTQVTPRETDTIERLRSALNAPASAPVPEAPSTSAAPATPSSGPATPPEGTGSTSGTNE
jgi:hypothetical protein